MTIYRPDTELTVLELQEMFGDAKSMAIVGSSSSVEQWNNGNYIDQHDIVVRFNRATTVGKEQHVGSRTDIVVANEANTLKKAPSPADTVNPKCVIMYMRPPSITREAAWREPFFEWVDKTPVFVTHGPEILWCDSPKRRRGYSMGTYALASLPYWLSIERLFVTGFTMFGSVPGGAHHYCKDSSRVEVTWHDADAEQHVFSNVLGAMSCELIVTDEVANLMEKSGFKATRYASGGTEPVVLAKHRPTAALWYLVERFSKLLLTAGYSIRRLSEKRRLASR